MSGQHREVEVIPRTGVAIAAGVASLLVLAWMLVLHASPLGPRIGFGAVLGLVVFLYGCLVAYVYGDARRRGMRPGAWAVVAALVPNALGFVAYFLLRDPVRRPCSSCGATSRRDVAFCPQCGSPLRDLCTACRRPVEPSWRNCGHCGAPLAEQVR